MDKIKLFDINFNNITMIEVLNEIEKIIKRKESKFFVTPNIDHIVQLQKDEEFKQIYNSADFVLADGMPIVWISKLLNKPIIEKVSGADITPQIFQIARKKGYKIFILGGREGVGNNLYLKFKENSHPNFSIGHYSPPFGFESIDDENKKITDLIAKFTPDILLVSLGAPKGEKWIFRNKENIQVPISIQVGAAIDFIAGTINRAPLWMQKYSLEWFYRFLQEPKRLFKRYFIQDIQIIKLLFIEIFTVKKFRSK
jgi:N-acetylglucosaminyldiphosphoundecaprenol N-acetyl-beta-D-mannosaminyltransferase